MNPSAPRGGPPSGATSGLFLFVLAGLFSPLILVAWVAGAALLRYTGWRGWRLALPAFGAGAVVVVVQGGPIPAVVTHFSGLYGLLSGFGAPMLHLHPPPGHSWSRRSR